LTTVIINHYNYNCLPTFHGGDVDAILNYLEKYSSQVLFIQVGFLVIIGAVFVWVWYYNRKKYNHLKHQIPASVVKNYLDSIIQNSTALKSSLFRGGGLDVDPNSIPSVMPVSDLPTGAPAGVDAGEISSLRAQIAQLQAQLAEKQNTITDLENKNTSLEGDVKAKQERIEELEKLLAEAQANGGGADPEAAAKLAEMTKERDELKATLAQYEVIEDDLANLKRLQQENEQLKKALADAGGAAPPPVEEPAAEPTPAAEPEPVAEAPAEPEPAPAEEAAPEPVAAAAEEPAGDDKSPEDLLSEFEKMLG
jgi:hypothetical protein